MSDVSDEMLMAYADGVLDATARALVDERLIDDAELARRLELFERTSSRSLAPAFDPLMRAPVPDRLLRAAGGEPAGLLLRAKQQRGFFAEMFGRLFEGIRAVLPQGMPPLGAALALAGTVLVVAYGARTLTIQVPEPDSFRIVLETVQSGTSVRFKARDGERVIVPVLSFQRQDGRYCRSYEVTRADQTRLSGVACRDDGGNWQIDFEADAGHAPAPGRHVTAGASGAAGLDDRIMETIKGDAFDRAQEDQLLRKGWK